MSQRPPMPPTTLPEQEALYRRSKYQRHRSPISIWALLLGIILGTGGSLYYAWYISPVVETDTRPDQLSYEEKSYYVVAIMLAHSYHSDLGITSQRLFELDLGGDPIQMVANMACNLASTGYVDSSAGIRAVRAMRTFYQLQGRTGCADNIIPDPQSVPLEVTVVVPTATATLPPPPTKTPSGDFPTPTLSLLAITPSAAPVGSFFGDVSGTFCSVELSGTIEVRVVDGAGREMGGQAIRVVWEGGRSDFVTGLKPERGEGYADFRMEAGLSYLVSMPNQSDPLNRPLEARPCTTEDTFEEAIYSYRVVFRQQ
jgi:hypothetical protein